jgi:site-specific recombinase XerD
MVPGTSPITLCDYLGNALDNLYVKDFDQYIAVAKLAATTKTLYSHYLALWGSWIEQNRIPLKKARPIDAAGFIASHPEWSDSTCYSACNAVRSFYAWRFGAKHPLLDFTVRRSDPGPQPTPDIEKLNKLLISLDTSSGVGRRHLAMITLMLDTGLRATEVCRLDLEHLDMDKGLLWVPRKGGKWKPARFFDYARSCMSSWLAVRPLYAKPHIKNVFVVTMAPDTGEPMDRNTLRVLFYRLGEKAGIGKFSPHQLRRAFATLAIDNGASSRLVQEAGGWADLQMLERYTQALNLDQMRSYSPVDRLMGLPKDNGNRTKTLEHS